MIKLLLIPAILSLGICGFSGAKEKRSAPADELATLINDYIGSGQYTKKTEINLSDLALEELKTYFHAGANSPKRRTYYDENANALLMGDYDGGFAHINSGYAKNGDNMEHYRNNAETKTTENLFSARQVDYVVNDTSPNEFFVNLSEVKSEASKNTWVKDDSTFKYAIDDLEQEGGHYKDKLLHDVQYFAAPMLLESAVAYFSPTEIDIKEEDNKLIINLYVSGADLTKLTNSEGLLASATILKGLILN